MTKITLLEMILICESETFRIDVWESVLRAEKTKLDANLMRRRLVFRKMGETLEWVLKQKLRQPTALVESDD